MADKVNLQKSYSAMNEKVADLFDGSGARRSVTVPYIEGQEMADHVAAVGQAASQVGGLSKNLMLSYHHGSGKGWGTGEGHTVGYMADKLRTTFIPEDDDKAKEAISAAQTHINNLGKLLGKDEPTVQTAQGQLNLVKHTDGAGMSLLDFGVLMTQIMYRPMQMLAQKYHKANGSQNQVQGNAPAPEEQQPQEEQGEDQGEQGGESEQADNAAPQQANAAPQQAALPAAAGAQAQG